MGFKKFLLAFFLFPLLSFGLSYKEILQDYQKSYFYEKIGDYKDAIRVLMPIFKAYPYGYTVNLRLGWLYYLWGKYENSIFHYRRAVSIAPYSAEAKLGLSLPLMAQNRWKDVEMLMYQIISVDYYNYYANLRLAKALKNEKKYWQSIAICQKMLRLYPDALPFLVLEGENYYKLGYLKTALDIFKNTLVLDPENNTIKGFIEEIEKKLQEGKKQNGNAEGGKKSG